MRVIRWLFGFAGKAVLLFLIVTIGLSVLYIGYKGNQPMSVPQAPKGMTYFEFMQDRIDAAKTVQPARCGAGMFASLALMGPFYSVLYTYVAVEPESLLAKVTAPDPDIAKDASGASWMEIPDIWWKTVERLSWTMLKSSNPGCKFRPVRLTGWVN